MNAQEYDITGQIMEFEEGNLDQQQIIELFQHLIDSDMIYSLQGSYQRMASALINHGHCILK